MSRRWTLVPALVTAALAAGTLAGAAQSDAAKADTDAKKQTEPQLYALYTEHVKPSMIAEYEAGLKELIKELAEYDVDPAKVGWKAVSGPEMGYVFVMPMDDFSGMDAMHASWTDVVETFGEERWMALAEKSDNCLTHRSFSHVMRRPELSYTPEKPALAPEDVHFIGYSFYYALPGHEQALEKVAKDYRALYARHGIRHGWSIYTAVTGSDLPLLIVAQGAKDEASYHANRAKTDETLGDEGTRLGEEAVRHARRIERKEAWIRPELSYPPSEAKH